MSEAAAKHEPAKNESALSAWVQKQAWLRKHGLLRTQGLKLLAVGITLIALSVSFILHQRAQEALVAAKNRYQQQQNTNLDAAHSAAVLNQYLVIYRGLQAQGLIKPPQRLQWLEALLASVNHHLVPKVSFILSRTEPASVTNTTYLHDTLAMKVTPLRVEFTLLHEGDFDRLVRELRAQAKGLFSVQSCEIRRSEEASAAQTDESTNETAGPQGNFKGYCDLLWYSLADITSTWEVPQ